MATSQTAPGWVDARQPLPRPGEFKPEPGYKGSLNKRKTSEAPTADPVYALAHAAGIPIVAAQMLIAAHIDLQTQITDLKAEIEWLKTKR
jgi:hypothetical protein